MLTIVEPWQDRVHYLGELVAHDGATWQALRDTGRSPPHEDWLCLAAAGADARSFSVRGTWDAEATYQALDVVALNGASFAARSDDPGTCPGPGWQMIAAQGKQGRPGDQGPRGERGQAGERGPSGRIMSMSINDDGLLTLLSEDGTTVSCDFYPLLAKLVVR